MHRHKVWERNDDDLLAQDNDPDWACRQLVRHWVNDHDGQGPEMDGYIGCQTCRNLVHRVGRFIVCERPYMNPPYATVKAVAEKYKERMERAYDATEGNDPQRGRQDSGTTVEKASSGSGVTAGAEAVGLSGDGEGVDRGAAVNRSLKKRFKTGY